MQDVVADDVMLGVKRWRFWDIQKRQVRHITVVGPLRNGPRVVNSDGR